jgi:hypothetical protein
MYVWTVEVRRPGSVNSTTGDSDRDPVGTPERGEFPRRRGGNLLRKVSPLGRRPSGPLEFCP